MRNQRIVFLVVLVIAAALMVGYLIGRGPALDGAETTAARPKPKASAPRETTNRSRKTLSSTSTDAKTLSSKDKVVAPTLNDVFADLKRRADANDPNAAAELFRDLRRCQMQQELSDALPQWMKNEFDSDTSADTPDELARREKYLDAMQKEVDFVQRYQAFCANANPDALVQLVPSTLKAAQLGDLHAVRCYIGNEVEMVPGLIDHPEWISDFKQNAIPLAQYGIQHGDWGTAGLLAFAYRGTFSSSLFTQAVKPDPLQAYQYTKLQALGASDSFATKIQQQVDEAAEGLTPEQIAQGDAWAKDMYERYFNGTSSNELSNGVNTCSDGG
ncbi:MAG TPA: hypothetical protein VH082_04610 [Rudaea sp.]|jgi:hypothetical protein|nr:hypothetical protein [Rudaea sp.]